MRHNNHTLRFTSCQQRATYRYLIVTDPLSDCPYVHQKGSREYSAEQLPWKFSDQRVISLAPVSAKTGEGVHESMLALLGLIMHTTSIDPRMLLFLLDLIAPVSPHFLSGLPSDLKLMVRVLSLPAICSLGGSALTS